MQFAVPQRIFSLSRGAWLLVALMGALAGCAKISSGGSATTIITNIGGNNSDENYIGFVGSCLSQKDGATVSCIDMYFDPNPQTDCNSSLSGTFSASHCDQSEAVGECMVTASSANYDLYYYSPYTAQTASSECSTIAGATSTTFNPIGSQQATSVAGVWTGPCVPAASGSLAARRTFYFDFAGGSTSQGDYAVETDFYLDNSCVNLAGYAQAYGNFSLGSSVSVSSPSGTVSASLLDLTQTSNQYIANTATQMETICGESLPPSTFNVTSPPQCPGVTKGELTSGSIFPDVVYFPPQGGLAFGNSNVFGNPPASGPGSSDSSPYTSLEQSDGAFILYTGP